VSRVTHGGISEQELRGLGLRREDVLDLSASLHPDGAHPRIVEALRAADISHYPESDARSLRDALAQRANLDPAQVLVTAGATAAIHLATRAMLNRGDVCATFPPTFGEYAEAVRLAGASVREHRARAPRFEIEVAIEPCAMVILCNPDNPTGRYLDRAQVERLLDSSAAPLLLDAAYEAFVPDAWEADALARQGMPVLVVHSLTKLHATPGLRVGYVVGPAPLIARLEERQPAWSISGPAIAAALAMLDVDEVQRQAATRTAATRNEIIAMLTADGVECADGQANFVLARVGDGSAFRERLLRRHRIAVRDCASFGLPDYVRIAAPPVAQAARVMGSLREALATSRPAARP
jgi:histidinol-phosphate/aromatic aminotransferase/cobyric acid decarboxylase-like protein